MDHVQESAPRHWPRPTAGDTSRWETDLLEGARELCTALYAEEIEAGARSFEIWKRYWIASNGELGRKKEVPLDALASVVGCKREIDPYRFLFIVESAIVFISSEVCGAAASEPLSINAASRVFDWWKFGCSAATSKIADKLRRNLGRACRYELISLLSADPLRNVYHALIPKAIRHTLGAYLSPPDLCQYVLQNLSVQEIFGSAEKTVLEPSCGLGSFFCALLSEGMRAAERQEITLEKLSDVFSRQVYGIEKNLGSYVVARHLHSAICTLLRGSKYESDNILWADSVYVDEGYISQKLSPTLLFPGRSLLIGFMRVTCTAERVDYSEVLNNGTVISHFDGQDWKNSAEPLGTWLNDRLDVDERELQELAVRDSVRQETLGEFDYILGNPPWVNWENLDPNYKKFILPSWPHLGLFAMTGRDRAFSKEDLSTLATYSACLRFGKIATRVGLLLPQALFQSRKNAKGFRGFRIGHTGAYLHIDHTTDFTNYAAFGDAKNRTAAFFFSLREEPTIFPVKYLRFVPGTAAGVARGTFEVLWATPSNRNDPSSNWALYGEHEEIQKPKIAGATYRARTGVFTGGANAVFYVRVRHEEPNDHLVVLENDTERAKIKVDKRRFVSERNYLYPFAKGRDLQQWKVRRPDDQGILLPHSVDTRIKPISPSVLASDAPKTLTYLSQFKEMLSSRASLTALDRANVAEGFYALLRVGEYTFAPYKVAWRYISRSFCCAVVGPTEICGEKKPTVLQEKLISIAFFDEEEAYFVCAFLSSPRVKREIERRIVGTQVSVHVIEDIHIPFFDRENSLHRRMAAVCKEGHDHDGLTEARSEILASLVKEIEAVETNSLACPDSTISSPDSAGLYQSTTLISAGT